MNARRLLVTGASGELGHAVLRALDQCPSARNTEVVFLMRTPDGGDLRRASSLLLARAGVQDVRRFRAIAGDITSPMLADSQQARRDLAAGLDGILHIAADTSFSKPIAPMRIANVEGTRHVVDLAREAGGVPIGHVSSLYASGGHTGTIEERRLPRPPLFVNAYEQSKWEAEELLFESGAPFCIFRCGVMPSTSSGVVQRLAAFHLLAALYHQNLVGFAPGRPECPLDVVATDDTANAMVALFLDHFEAGAVFHLGQAARAPRIDDLAARVQQAFARSHLGQGRRLDPTEFVTRDVFDALRDSARLTRNMRLVRALGLTQSFMPQLFYPKAFVNDNVSKHIQVQDFTDPLTVIERAVTYCINTQWLFTLGADGGQANEELTEAARMILCQAAGKARAGEPGSRIHPDLDLTRVLGRHDLEELGAYADAVCHVGFWQELCDGGDITGRAVDALSGSALVEGP